MNKKMISNSFRSSKLTLILLTIFLVSCTSNTIFKKPKDLIPKDTMSLLIQELMIASSAKYIKNKNLQKNINYMPFVYDAFKIDSLRFQNSNLYYMSKIDVYEEILANAETNLESKKNFFREIDSLKKDSISKSKIHLLKLDSIKNSKKELE